MTSSDRINAAGQPQIAIVGVGGFFPGAPRLDLFWTNCRDGVDSSKEAPSERWLIAPAAARSQTSGQLDCVSTTRGYFLNDNPSLPAGLQVNKDLLHDLDVSVRLAVVAVCQAWNCAQTENLNPRRVQTILGHIALPTENVSRLSCEILDGLEVPKSVTDNLRSWNRFVAGLPALIAARALGLTGGAMCLDAACASSLYALKIAVDELQSNRADAVIAGGLSRPDCLYTQMGFSQLRALSPSGRCSPFDAAADGLMVGEGAGVFVLKRLADAERDGDSIRAVIAGIGLSNDREGNLLAPASEGQLRAMRSAYKIAGWSPTDVDMIECHATGTPLGDAVEFQSMRELWKSSDWRVGQCAVGSAKSNVGHLLTGAGAAGLMRTIFAMKHGVLPPTANYRHAASAIRMDGTPFRILQFAEGWPRTDRPRRAAVSAFGFGGINAHVLVEEYQPHRIGERRVPAPRVSCRDQIAIVGLAARTADACGITGVDVPFGRFPIPPREFTAMMPQQAMMLLTAADAFADARFTSLPDADAIGVFIGCNLDLNTTNFNYRWSRPVEDRDDAGPPLTPERVLGHLASITASRIARTFRIGGPSFGFSSESTSFLDGVRLAISALERGELRVALVGVADNPHDPRRPATTTPDGAVAIVLTRLSEAQKLSLEPYALIELVNEPSESVIECGDEESPLRPGLAMLQFIEAADNSAEPVISAMGMDHVRRQVRLRRAMPRREYVSNASVESGPMFYVPFATPAHVDREKSRVSAKIASRDVTPVNERHLATHAAASSLLVSAHSAVANAHQTYLRFSQDTDRNMQEWFARQTQLAEQFIDSSPNYPSALGTHQLPNRARDSSPFLDREQCLEFAIGQIGKVLGSRYAQVDSYPTRVRLPDEPLMLVDRIIEVQGEPLSLASGRVLTEHDVTTDRWYLDHGRMPTCIAVESGQADLFLSGYLGIDLQTHGQEVYRLLDAVVTFHHELPAPDSVVRYDIHIDRFFRQGDTHLFRFRFESTVNGQPLLSMTDGCAGFFTPSELNAGQGIIQTAYQRRNEPRSLPGDWIPLTPFGRLESYDDRQIDALRLGNVSACFGPAFANLPIRNPTRLPGGRMRLIHRVPHMDPRGGRFGLGFIRAEADVRPDDWYLTCHFIDDQVMPGTLMYECCLHTLRVFLMRLGWVGEQDEVAWQPVPGIASRLKCRGQVIASTRQVTYEVSVKEMGYRPEPHALADVLMYADGKPIVEITDMSIRLTGTDRQKLHRVWQSANRHSALSTQHSQGRRAIFDHDRILAFAIGNPSEAFGNRYRVFDSERVIARLPGPPYQFLDRIVKVDAEPWIMKAGGCIEAEYDVPPEAWYFAEARRPIMPFAVLLEVALQPCGWLAAYIGSALTSPIDLSFRNLGGRATQHQRVTPASGTLTTHVSITDVSTSAGMIIQHYAFKMTDAMSRVVYDGTTYFGFFSKSALHNQVGIAGVEPIMAPKTFTQYPCNAPFAGRMLRMIHQIALSANSTAIGGKAVDPTEWFFKAHFHQDSVMPGSLGLEAFLQLLQFQAVNEWGHSIDFEAPALGISHEWIYRGQVVPGHQNVLVQSKLTKMDDSERLMYADGILCVDNRVIYRMTGFTARG